MLKKKLNNEDWRTIWITSVYSAWPTRGAGRIVDPGESTRTYRRHSPTRRIDFSGTLIRLHIGLEDVDDLLPIWTPVLRELYNIATFGQFADILL